MFKGSWGSSLALGGHEVILFAKVFTVVFFGSGGTEAFNTCKGR